MMDEERKDNQEIWIQSTYRVNYNWRGAKQDDFTQCCFYTTDIYLHVVQNQSIEKLMPTQMKFKTLMLAMVTSWLWWSWRWHKPSNNLGPNDSGLFAHSHKNCTEFQHQQIHTFRSQKSCKLTDNFSENLLPNYAQQSFPCFLLPTRLSSREKT